MRLRKYCTVHDSLWRQGERCDEACYLLDVTAEIVEDCRFQSVDLVFKRWV